MNSSYDNQIACNSNNFPTLTLLTYCSFIKIDNLQSTQNDCNLKINNWSEELTGSEHHSDNAKNNKLLLQDKLKSFKEKFECRICQKLLYSPNITKCCGETACYDCFHQFREMNMCTKCPFCNASNFKVMPNFKIQQMKEMIIKQFNIKIEKETTNKNIFQSFQSLSPYRMDLFFSNVNIDRLLSNAKFFIIKSFNLENIEISKRHNKWATTKVNQKKLNEAFESKFVILLFSANKSGGFQGFAIMTSSILNNFSRNNRCNRDNLWKIDEDGLGSFNLGSSFDIKWLSESELPFHRLKNFYNPLNNNEPIAKSRDTQELPENLGIRICKMFVVKNNISIEDVLERVDRNRNKRNNFNRNRRRENECSYEGKFLSNKNKRHTRESTDYSSS
jgi:hypothetical protein